MNNRIENLSTRVGIDNKADIKWTEKEKSDLLHCYKDMAYDELAKKFGRSVKAIRQKIKNLQLSKRDCRKNWTKDDDEKLAELYGNSALSVNDIAKAMNKSSSSIRLRANRKGNIYRSDRHLRELLGKNNFYLAVKGAILRNSLWAKCCLCNYSKYIDLHHIDNNNKNNHISNIATLCPNHHREVSSGEHTEKFLYAIWKRKYSDGRLGKIHNNIQEIKENNVEKKSNK